MICPSCDKGRLKPAYLDNLFPCHTCSTCGGNWVRLPDYLRWRETNAFPAKGSVTLEAVTDTTKAMICPETGRIMLKYLISKETDHRIDLSRLANAVWLDKGEWDLLKAEGLTGNLHEIFTDQWQASIRESETADVLTAVYGQKFGKDYAELKRIRSWLRTKDNYSDMLAYLIAADPYKVDA